MSDPTPKSVVENVNTVVELEASLHARRTAGERGGELVVGVAGTLTFVAGQLAASVAWIVVNSGLVPWVRSFDPFPYALGGELLSLEGVLLACFVLMKQRHESRLSERRAHLALQGVLLVEREVTKLIQMVHRQSVLDGTDHQVLDEEVHELGKDTAIGKLSEALDDRLEGKPL